MKKNLLLKTLMLVVMAGLLLTVSCSQKTVPSDLNAGNENQLSQEEQAAREAALKAEALAKEKERAAIEAQRLKDEAQREREAAERKAEEERFENQDIQFAYDSAELTPMSRMVLKEKSAWLSRNSHVKISIEGHCDDRGTTEYNLALGEKRALAAKSYLQDLGIAGGRMNTISYGEEKPLVHGNDEASWAKNRRAHFVIQ